MARFVVRFLKDVLGENGHEAEICQSYLEIEAANRTEAVELGKRNFVRKRYLPIGRFTQTGCRWPRLNSHRDMLLRPRGRTQEIVKTVSAVAPCEKRAGCREISTEFPLTFARKACRSKSCVAVFLMFAIKIKLSEQL